MDQIWSQIEKLTSLEIRDVPWRISMATTRRGAFIWVPEADQLGPRPESIYSQRQKPERQELHDASADSHIGYNNQSAHA